MTPEFTFDYDDFQAKLYQATRRAVTDLFAQHPHETFYALTLHVENIHHSHRLSPDTIGILRLSMSSEEALTQIAQKMFVHPRNKIQGLSLFQMRMLCRDTPTYSLKDNPDFYTLSYLVEQYWDWFGQAVALNKSSFKLLCKHANAHITRMIDICLTVLAQLDQVGLFGEGAIRHQFLLNLRFGDWLSYSEENIEKRLQYARILNPQVVCDEYEKEIRLAWSAQNRWHS